MRRGGGRDKITNEKYFITGQPSVWTEDNGVVSSRWLPAPYLQSRALTFSCEEGLVGLDLDQAHQGEQGEEGAGHAGSANPRVISTLRSQSSQASCHYKTLEMIQNIPSENFLKMSEKDSGLLVIISSVGPAQRRGCHVCSLVTVLSLNIHLTLVTD